MQDDFLLFHKGGLLLSKKEIMGIDEISMHLLSVGI